MNFRIIAAALVAWGIAVSGTLAEVVEPPKAVEPGVKISLYAAEPEVVTPIGATVDVRGRLLVVESNTHFRPKNYKGPTADRILILEGAGDKAEHITTFYEGNQYLMNVVAARDGSVLVSQRNEIFRLYPDAEGKAGPKVSLAHLETKADYPHNGLHSLAVGPGGSIYFGIGENFGEPWKLIGSDGRELSDKTGTGMVFRMDSQGRGLTRVARGFWNPFGLGVDPNGQLWAVDNDPDGRPPCRLIDIAPGAHYGFEFRYGRTGLHPLQAWNGELPGTLGMAAGVGEAPSAVMWGRGRLFVSSWRDHQVESYNLTPRGATYSGAVHVIAKGGDDFRPVGLAFGNDGTLYVTDWASKSYPVHGAGRIWKITFGGAADSAAPEVNEARKHAQGLRDSKDLQELTAALNDPDPATAQAAQYGLSRLDGVQKIPWSSLKTPRQRIGLLAALLERGTDTTALATDALRDEDDQVRQIGVRCITEQGIKAARADLERLLTSQTLSPRLLGMTVAAINQIDGDPAARVDSRKINAVLLGRIDEPGATDTAKTTALHMMQISHPRIELDKLRAMATSPNNGLELEAVRFLNSDTDPARYEVLSQIASDVKRDPAVRAEAVLGLAVDPTTHLDLLVKLAEDPDEAVRAEALRALRPAGAKLSAEQRKRLQGVASGRSTDAEGVARVIAPPPTGRPDDSDEAAWQRIVAAAPGNPNAGRRIFFQPNGAACYRCHTIEGRGRAIGPDLTMIGHSQTREHVLESILNPSREVAPLYTLWTIRTRDGTVIDGVLLRRDGQENEVYVDSTGHETKVKEPTIVDRRMRNESLMPAGLVQMLTDQELRDVVAFLMEKR